MTDAQQHWWKSTKQDYQLVADMIACSALTSPPDEIQYHIAHLTKILDRLQGVAVLPDVEEDHRSLKNAILHLRRSYSLALKNDWGEADYQHHLAILIMATLDALYADPNATV